MGKIRIHLFGKFRMTSGNQEPVALPTRRAEELLSYLVLHRKRVHSREMLAALLWDGASVTQSRKYLRHTLWQVQAVLGPHAGSRHPALLIEPEWIGFTGDGQFWIDIVQFEEACTKTQASSGPDLSDDGAVSLRSAARLYDGDLLQGWYCEWCLAERDRFQGMLVMLLDKLMEHAEAHRRYNEAIAYGQQVLVFDRARERTHQLLMRTYYLAGDRTAALRQFERCASALKEDLAVSPARVTLALHEEIRTDRSGPALTALAAAPTDVSALSQLHTLLADMQARIEEGLTAVERAIAGRGQTRA